MRNQLLRRLGDNRPQLITLGIVAIFAAMLGCGGGGGGGGGTTSTSTTSTSTTSTSTTSTSTTSTSTTSTSTTAGSTTSETTGSTGSSLPANRIFFQDSSLDIKHMNPDGSDEQTYSPIDPGFKAFAQNPVNSNIKAFAFTAIPSNPPTFAQYDIYINSSVSLTGATKLTSIAKADVGSIMFTPDGSKIVFTAATGTMVLDPDTNTLVPEYSYQLFVVDSAVPNQTPIPLDAADDAYVAPTGLRIVYTYWPLSSANPRIATINIDGTNKTILTHPSGPISTANYMPQYSKDGTKICFGSNRTAQFEIWRMNSNGGSPNQVTNINSNSEDRCYGSSFSGDGSEVAFTRISSSVGNAGVYRVPSAGGTELLIRPGFVQPWIYWSPPSSSMPGRGVGSASTPLGFGTSIRIKKLLGIEEN